VAPEEELAAEYLIRLCFAPFVGTVGVFFGKAVGMDISGKLLLLTWLLVCMLTLIRVTFRVSIGHIGFDNGMPSADLAACVHAPAD
jgi:hypothetical protein